MYNMEIKCYENRKIEGIYFNRGLTDLIKMLCCVMVALHHYSQYVLSHNIASNLFYMALSAQGGYLGVGIFFFLSGYGLIKSDMNKHLSFLMFIKKRITKVYLPVLLISIIWFPIYRIIEDNPTSLQDVISVFWKWNDNVLWFIRIILELYLFFYIYSEIRLLHYKNIKGITLSLFFIGAIIYTILSNKSYTISIPLFFLGIACGEFSYLRKVFSNSWRVLMLIIIAILGIIFSHQPSLKPMLYNYIVIFLLMWICSKWRIAISKLPKFVGGASFDVYLTHNKILMVLKYFMPIVPIWLFMTLTIVSTTLFYNLRKLLNL